LLENSPAAHTSHPETLTCDSPFSFPSFSSSPVRFRLLPSPLSVSALPLLSSSTPVAFRCAPKFFQRQRHVLARPHLGAVVVLLVALTSRWAAASLLRAAQASSAFAQRGVSSARFTGRCRHACLALALRCQRRGRRSFHGRTMLCESVLPFILLHTLWGSWM
jgi:hypothetical protein